MDQSFSKLEQSLCNIEDIFQNLQPQRKHGNSMDFHEQLEILERIYMDMLINLESLVQKSDIYNVANETNQIKKSKINTLLDHLEHFHEKILNLRDNLDKKETNGETIEPITNNILETSDEIEENRTPASIQNGDETVEDRKFKVANEMCLKVSGQKYTHSSNDNIGFFIVDKSKINVNNLLSAFCNRKIVEVLFRINESPINENCVKFLRISTENRGNFVNILNADEKQNLIGINLNYKNENNVYATNLGTSKILRKSKQKALKCISSNSCEQPHPQNTRKDSIEDQVKPLNNHHTVVEDNNAVFNGDDDEYDGFNKTQNMSIMKNNEECTLQVQAEVPDKEDLTISDVETSEQQHDEKDDENKICKNFVKELEKLRKWMNREEDRIKNVCMSKQRVDKVKLNRNKRGLQRLMEFCAFLRLEFKLNDVLIIEKFLEKKLDFIERYNIVI